MTVQIVEFSGQRIAMLPIAEYERLLDLAEDRADANAAAKAAQRRSDGEEYLPAAMVDRLLNGENALKIWRQFRGITQTQLGQRVGVSCGQISYVEKGERRGSPILWRALADALNVTLDDIMPEGEAA